jgi:hypothetical protein
MINHPTAIYTTRRGIWVDARLHQQAANQLHIGRLLD